MTEDLIYRVLSFDWILKLPSFFQPFQDLVFGDRYPPVGTSPWWHSQKIRRDP